MAYTLNEDMVKRRLPQAFKTSKLLYSGKEVQTNTLRVISSSFTELSVFMYRVHGKISISQPVKGDKGSTIEDIYYYTTTITVNMEDEIVSCKEILLSQ